MGAGIFVAGDGGLWSGCAACTQIDTSDWLFCIDDDHQQALPSKVKGGRRRRSNNGKDPWPAVSAQHLEELTKQLFSIHDLNGDGLLSESELITLNEQIAILHHGKDTDTAEIRDKYHELFRTRLDPDGRPVPYEIFREYAAEVLDGLDNDPEAQEMILEQFVAEARSGRQAFDLGITALLGLAPEPKSEPEETASSRAAVCEDEVTLAGIAVKAPKPPSAPRSPVGTGDQPMTPRGCLMEELEASQCSPASGHTDGTGEDLAGCSTDAPTPRPGGARADSSAEEAGSSFAEVGTAGPASAGYFGQPGAAGSGALLEPISRAESSMDGEQCQRFSPRISGCSLVVEQRNVRRASCNQEDEEASVERKGKWPPRSFGDVDIAPQAPLEPVIPGPL